MPRLKLAGLIREVPNWPKPGVNFKDITPLLQNAVAFRQAINQLSRPWAKKKIDVVVGIDARGFILAAAVAYRLRAGLAIIRKPGKLPRPTISQSYLLEYGQNTLEMHRDAIASGQSVLVVDDVLATGGTMQAAVRLVQTQGGRIAGLAFLLVLTKLGGAQKLKGLPIHAVLRG